MLAGIATYAAKFVARTPPPEGWQMAIELLRARLVERDRALQRLQDESDRLAEDQEPEELVKRYVDRALVASRRGDRPFWLTVTADVLNAEPDPHLAAPLFRLAARRISATQAVEIRERHAAVRFLAANVVQIP